MEDRQADLLRHELRKARRPRDHHDHLGAPDVVHDSADAHIGFYVRTVNTAETGAIGSSDERDVRRFCSSLAGTAGAT